MKSGDPIPEIHRAIENAVEDLLEGLGHWFMEIDRMERRMSPGTKEASDPASPGDLEKFAEIAQIIGGQKPSNAAIMEFADANRDGRISLGEAKRAVAKATGKRMTAKLAA